MSVGSRIEEYRLQKGYKVNELARLVGISGGSLSDIKNGNTEPRSDTLEKFIRNTDVNSYWLLTGEGPMIRQPGQPHINETQAAYADETQAQPDFVFIPQVVGRIAAGGGLAPDNRVDMRVAFRSDWIRRKGNPAKMSLIKVLGDSMENTLLSGDLVLVDHGRDYLDPQGGIYALALNDDIVIKRLERVPGTDRVRIMSDNKRYEPLELPAAQVKINGKVIWFGRELERE